MTRYTDCFFANKGTYWSSAGWSQCSELPDRATRERAYSEYLSKYGKTKADKLIAASDNWKDGYSRLTFIQWDGIDCAGSIDDCRRCAEYNGWDFDILHGDSSLISSLLYARWHDEDFLIAQPHETITQSYDERIVSTNGN